MPRVSLVGEPRRAPRSDPTNPIGGQTKPPHGLSTPGLLDPGTGPGISSSSRAFVVSTGSTVACACPVSL